LNRLSLSVLLGLTVQLWCGHDFFSAGYGEYGAEFLKLPRHAQNAGLATATVAWSDDLAGLQYNPSLMAYNSAHHASVTYTFLTLDRVQYGLNYATPTYAGFNYGITVVDLGVDGFEERNDEGNKLGEFDENEFAAEFVFAGQVKGLFAYGAAIRYLQQRIGEFQDGGAKGFGLDLGLHYKPFDKINVGASFLNLGSKLYWDTGKEDDVVPTFRIGVLGNIVDSIFSAEVDVIKPRNQPIESAMGIQGTLFNILALRAGMVNAVNWNENGAVIMDPEFYLGTGIRYMSFGLDYAAMKPGSDLGLGHKLTVVVRFP